MISLVDNTCWRYNIVGVILMGCGAVSWVSGFGYSFETVGTTQPTKQHNISEYLNPQSVYKLFTLLE
jgi:hypothetical protein